MGVFGEQWFAATGGYEIDNSCIMDDASSIVLTRTQHASPTNEKIWTFSCWIKRGNLSLANSGKIFGGYDASSGAQEHFDFSDGASNAADNLNLYAHNAGASGVDNNLSTNAKFRDVAAWYHLVVAKDTTQGTAANRLKLWVNGVAQTFTGTSYPSEDFATGRINLGGKAQYLGSWQNTNANYDGYMAEAHFLDGTVKAASDFGEYDSNGTWIPSEYTAGGYGNNGFFLDFADSGDLGDDESGNGNDFAETNLATTDQSKDTPTNNQITFNPLNNQRSGADSVTQGNLIYNGPGTRTMITLTSNIPPTGKWAVAFSASVVSTNVGWNFGITKSNDADFGDAAGSNEDIGANSGLNMSPSSSNIQINDNGGGGGSIDPNQAITTSDEFWMAVDMATGKCHLGIYDDSADAMVWFAADAGLDGDPENGTNPTATIAAMIGTTEYAFAAAGSKGNANITLLKSTEIDGTTPTGFTYFENVSDFPAPALSDPSTNFQTVLYTGNGTAIGSGGKAVTFGGNSDMQPDIVWIKNRSQADDGQLYDAPRGVTKQVEPSARTDETTESEGLTTFGSDGFTVGSRNEVNTNTENYVAWAWAAGNSGASNTDGTINTTSTFVDTTAGISVSTYTGNGTDGATVGHGLGVTPKTVLIFQRSNNDHHTISNWRDGVTAFTEKMNLDRDDAADSSSTQIKGGSSTTFTLGSDAGLNGDTRTYVAYCWAEVHGFSRFGTYTGNGDADGPFAWCGFKPAWVMVKPESRSDGWIVWDTQRNTYNLTNLYLQAGSSNQEFTASVRIIDILSNGFKIKNGHNSVNNSGDFYIYMAFADKPFGGSGVSPATAR